LAKIRLLIDEDVSKGPQLAAALRRRGFDAVAVQEVGRMGFSDKEQLDYAAAHGRTFLTFNIKDFVSYGREWYEAGEEHSGIVVSAHLTGRQFGELLHCTLNLLNTLPADEMRNTVRFLQEFKNKDI
jgi:predicted nuclease of predicted toxin-antitoxin system